MVFEFLAVAIVGIGVYEELIIPAVTTGWAYLQGLV